MKPRRYIYSLSVLILLGLSFAASAGGAGPAPSGILADIEGDVNGDAWVAGDDLSIIISYWGQSGLGREYGDLNGNGTVDGPDYTEVIAYWGTPEPATLGLLLLGGLAALIRRRK